MWGLLMIPKDMLAKASRNKSKCAADNVEFIKASITNIPGLADGFVDCIISNCVINLLPESEKPLAFKEMHRLLKKGGRVAISDILLKAEMPPELKSNAALYVGCIAGASKVEQYQDYLASAGFRGK
jgi:arsenite methyltransferase